MNDLFLRAVRLDRSEESLRGSWVWSIPALRGPDRLELHKSVTFLTGENGSGKSTLLEAIAAALGLCPEGGTQNYRLSGCGDGSGLERAARLERGFRRPKKTCFLRAESFYNVATAAATEYQDGSMPDYHARSHGESFLDFIQDNRVPGLWLMDEPEAALSPQRQLTLMALIDRMAREGSQFLIATHSPLLTALPGAEILSLDGEGIRAVRYEETGCYRVTRMFMEQRDKMLRTLLEED